MSDQTALRTCVRRAAHIINHTTYMTGAACDKNLLICDCNYPYPKAWLLIGLTKEGSDRSTQHRALSLEQIYIYQD